jgi:hypothetical protein
MSTMLERMRQRNQARQVTYERDYSIYPFWNIKVGSSSSLRLLPWNEPNTGMFWAERVLLPMQFSDASDPTKVIKFLAPCREMYVQSEKCPILASVRDLYTEEKELRNSGASKDADKLKKIAGFHWKKPTYYYQGFVAKSGMVEEELPDNPIRVFPINKQIHKLIYGSIFESDEDAFESLPTGEFTEEDIANLLVDGADVDMSKFNGYNFIVKKAQSGDYADWTSGTTWSRTMTPLDDEQLAALAEHGFHDLSKRLPDRPSDSDYDTLTEMMEISIQRMITGENGVWNKEWEDAGFKPVRQRGDDAKTDAKPAASSSAAKASKGADTPADNGGVSDAMAKLKAARGKATASVANEASDASETPAAVSTDAAVDDTPTEAAETGVSDLAAKIKARVSKNA